MHLGETYHKFEKDCQDEVKAIQETMGEGRCSNWEQYLKLVGEIQGIHKAMDHAKASYDALQSEDDDDKQ